MQTKKIVLGLFIVLAIGQLYFLSNLILEQEAIIAEGIPFKFKTVPLDPNDPFRGKYINLAFEESEFDIPNELSFGSGQTVYASVEKDADGFAKVTKLSSDPPSVGDFFKCKVSYIMDYESNTVRLEFPFERFYMEEHKAKPAELLFQNANPDSLLMAFALVYIKNGDAVIADVFVDNVSIKELVK